MLLRLRADGAGHERPRPPSEVRAVVGLPEARPAR